MGKKIILLIIIFIALLTSLFSSCSKDSPSEPKAEPAVILDHQKLQAALDSSLAECQTGRGVAAAVIGPGENVWVGVSGISNAVPADEITNEMLFNVGWRTADMFLAALILRYEEDGLLSIDDPISNWIPDYPYIDEHAITVRQLLRHTSGLFNYAEHPNFPCFNFYTMNHLKTWTSEEIVTTFMSDPYFAPGNGWYASNTDYLLLRMIIDNISQSNIVQHFRDYLFTPIGINNIYLEYLETIPENYKIAHGWYWNLSGTDVNDISFVPRTAIATLQPLSILSTAEDLAKWTKALFEGELLTEASLDKMLNFHSTGSADPNVPDYGLGVYRGYPANIEFWGHIGWEFGYDIVAAYSPEHQFYIVNLYNFNGDGLDTIFPAILFSVLEDLGETE